MFGLEIEVEFAQIYKNQPLFVDIDIFARNHGFQLFDICPLYWKREPGKNYGEQKGQIIFADVLYLKELEIFNKYLDGVTVDFRKPKILKAISICALYGYMDYALELFRGQENLFNENEIQVFNKFLKRNIPLSNKIPDFRGRNRIANIFFSIYNIIKPSYHGWAFGGKNLGNRK